VLVRKKYYDPNIFHLPTDTHNAESVELLKHSKIDKNAPTCFGLHRDHLQGVKVSKKQSRYRPGVAQRVPES